VQAGYIRDLYRLKMVLIHYEKKKETNKSYNMQDKETLQFAS